MGNAHTLAVIREVHKKFVQKVRVFPSNSIRHMRQGRTRRGRDEDGGGDVPDLVEMFDWQKPRRFGFISADQRDENAAENIPVHAEVLVSVEPVSAKRVPNVPQCTATAVSDTSDTARVRKTVSTDEAHGALRSAYTQLLARNAGITTQVLAEVAGTIVGWKASTMYKFIHQTLDADERKELGLKVRAVHE